MSQNIKKYSNSDTKIHIKENTLIEVNKNWT